MISDTDKGFEPGVVHAHQGRSVRFCRVELRHRHGPPTSLQLLRGAFIRLRARRKAMMSLLLVLSARGRERAGLLRADRDRFIGSLITVAFGVGVGACCWR